MLYLPKPKHYVPHIDNATGPGVYFVRDKLFNELFPYDDLCKIGYSHNLQERFSQFPNRSTLELFDVKLFPKETHWRHLRKVENEWMCSISYAYSPFLNQSLLDRNNFCCMSTDMKDYFKKMMSSPKGISTNWGSTEWFVI